MFPDILSENSDYEFKAKLSDSEPEKWAETMVGFANSKKGGYLFLGVSDERAAFGLTLKEIDEEKNVISLINNRHIFPHIRYQFSMKNINDTLKRFVLSVYVFPSDSIVIYKEGDFSEKVYVKGEEGHRVSARTKEKDGYLKDAFRDFGMI